MNQPLSPALLVPERLSAQAVQTARVAALAKGRPLLDVLEEQSGLAPREFSTLLGASFGLRCLTPQDLELAIPDFERMPFTETSRRRCLCLELEDGTLTAAIADPFDQGLREWARFALPAGTRLCLVQGGDLDAYLARQEEAMSAMTGLLVYYAAEC